ncbi:hypothetical protein EYF80_010791 [Liparis tanakae]|uniref:Uncharacterized protein n=1 Tax=Liparis tanakae TaxID=230148 RepID=A0A4Z2IPH1_9TELE|nr:hypothetical protein EYF80_010791 [Liparis tanakae]
MERRWEGESDSFPRASSSMCCLLGNPSLGQSQQGNGITEGTKLPRRNIPVSFQYVPSSTDKPARHI